MSQREPPAGQSRALRPREALTVKGQLEGKTRTQAMIDAGYAVATARKQSNAGLRRINGELCLALEAQGLTAHAFAEKLRDGLEATHSVVSRGEVVAQEPDHRARALYAKLVVDVCGDAAPTVHEHSHSGTLNVDIKRQEQTAMWQGLTPVEQA